MPRLSAAALAERARSRNQQNGELDPRYKKILDQLNKQQQQRARLALRFCRERLRDHQGYTLPQIVVVQEAAPIRRVGGL